MAATSAGPAWVRRLAVLGLTCTLLPTVVAADCAAGSSTLTTEGCSGCNEYAVCLGYTSADECSGSFCETNGDCTYQCMNVSDVTPTVVMLIDFGGFKSSQEVASIKAGSYSDANFTGYQFPDLTSEWPSANNDDVTAVGTINLPPTTTTFSISGGTADVNYPKGKVASVTLTSGFISSETQVTTVMLSSLAIGGQLAALPGLLPSSVQVIDLGNTLISTFPAGLSELSSLQQLLMDDNYVTTVDTLDVINTISVLSLENNNINTFSGVFSNLSHLYLGGNNLTSIPAAIYSHTELTVLNLTGNPFSTRDFTKDQADFLNNLETLLLSASDFTVGLECDESNQAVVHDVTVCLADIEDLQQIGSGAYATVWLVRYRNSQLLASKRLREERPQKKHTSNFVEEIKLLANFDHPNLVKLVGVAWTIETDLQALLEYMDGGDLRRYLLDPSTPCAWTFQKFNIAIDIIEALVYLHSFVPPLVHRDLKSMNVLLSSDFKAKLSDFGTSRFRSVESTMTAGVGTGRWLAPEVIRGDTDYGTSADIYSFGVLLTELDTNQIPYSNTRGSNGKKLSDMTILHRVATGKLHPEVRITCGPALRNLVQRCLVEDPAQRPAATVIAYELRVIQKDMAASL
ncbi:hypothetical protein JM18_008647 [Phytophthora kernoviae]|uniref:Protein kinase domain-containing protein n=2 Tax=Phytophthora kernoviae TaxID=325452 RepID=A0A921V3J2_9STRA|nr:hypothetical protein G195_005593 [Phytophthora kernoviae 00238/432]KAG2511650.1 hypothetical protein JM18_008647 [Phytophthora kernoviae]